MLFVYIKEFRNGNINLVLPPNQCCFLFFLLVLETLRILIEFNGLFYGEGDGSEDFLVRLEDEFLLVELNLMGSDDGIAFSLNSVLLLRNYVSLHCVLLFVNQLDFDMSRLLNLVCGKLVIVKEDVGVH